VVRGRAVSSRERERLSFPFVFAVPSSITGSACSYTCLSQEVLGLEGESIVSISAGENHSLVITKKA
jgi:hypothetical protein